MKKKPKFYDNSEAECHSQLLEQIPWSKLTDVVFADVNIRGVWLKVGSFMIHNKLGMLDGFYIFWEDWSFGCPVGDFYVLIFDFQIFQSKTWSIVISLHSEILWFELIYKT